MTLSRGLVHSLVMATRNTDTRSRSDVAYDMKLAGRRVRHAREDLGMSAPELAEVLTRATPVEWSHDMIRNLESGRRRIDPPLLRALMEELGRPAEYFLYEDIYTRPAASVGRVDPRYLNPERVATVTDIRSKKRVG